MLELANDIWTAAVHGGQPGYPWAGNTNVVLAMLADEPYITLAGADVAAVDSQQAYTASGDPTEFSFTQSDTGLDPLWEPTGWNGKGSVRGDGSEWLGTAQIHDFIEGDTSFILVTAYQQLTTANNDRIWSFGNTGNTTDFHEWFDDTSAARHGSFRRGGGTTREINSSDAPDLLRHVRALRFVAGATDQVEFWKDGAIETALTASDVSMGALDNFTLMGRRVGSAAASLITDMRWRASFLIVNDDTAALSAIQDYLVGEI